MISEYNKYSTEGFFFLKKHIVKTFGRQNKKTVLLLEVPKKEKWDHGGEEIFKEENGREFLRIKDRHNPWKNTTSP